MESKNTSSPVKDLRSPSNYDELLLQHSLHFAEGLKDLRNVKKQLYSAAEHFEDSYHKNDQKQILLESLKDYISKSLIKTVDHLGSVTDKVNKFLYEYVDEASKTKLRVLRFEQGLRTCRAYADHGGLAHQSLMIETSKYRKQYRIPDSCIAEAVETKQLKGHSSGLRKEYSEQASNEFPSRVIAFSFTKSASRKGVEKRSRSVSPLRFPAKRSDSADNQPTCPSFPIKLSPSFVHRSISPNPSSSRQQQPPEARRSRSLYPQRENTRDIEVYSKKTKNLFKALLSMHKSKNNYTQYR